MVSGDYIKLQAYKMESKVEIQLEVATWHDIFHYANT